MTIRLTGTKMIRPRVRRSRQICRNSFWITAVRRSQLDEGLRAAARMPASPRPGRGRGICRTASATSAGSCFTSLRMRTQAHQRFQNAPELSCQPRIVGDRVRRRLALLCEIASADAVYLGRKREVDGSLCSFLRADHERLHKPPAHAHGPTESAEVARDKTWMDRVDGDLGPSQAPRQLFRHHQERELGLAIGPGHSVAPSFELKVVDV